MTTHSAHFRGCGRLVAVPLGQLSAIYKRTSQLLVQLAKEEDGNIYPITSFLMTTLTVSIPIGYMFISIYSSMCDAGRLANLLIGIS
jgi:hypothetical protein